MLLRMQEIIKNKTMYGFSELLYINTQPVAGIPINNGTSLPFREYMYDANKGRDIWYSIKDGNFNDPTIWRTVGGRRKDFPNSAISTDDVYIRNVVTLNASSTLNNVYVSGTLQNDGSARTLNVQGNFQVSGTYDIKSTGSTTSLYGNNNYINNFAATTNSTIQYLRQGDQDIIPLAYWNLTTGSSLIRCTKYMTSDLVIGGALTMLSSTSAANQVIFECGTYNLTVTGITTVATANTLSKVGGGNVLFIGLLSLSTNTPTVDFTVGNPSVEFRGGITQGASLSTIVNFGSGTSTFSTNSQTISWGANGGTYSFNNLLVSGAITLTNISTSGLGGFLAISGTLDGDNASSAFVNKAGVTFLNASSYLPMPTLGTFDKDTFINVISYSFNGGFTIPYTTYQALTVSGTGTKTLLADTVLSSNLFLISVTFDCSTFNLTVTGTSNISGTFRKTGAGNVILVGTLTSNTNGTIWDFGAATNIELRGGISFGNATGQTFNGGAVWKFSTNNQSWTSTSGTFTPTGTWNILISGAITLTNSVVGTVVITGTLNGNNAASTFDNRAILRYRSATQPMATGILTVNGGLNTFIYDGATNQDLTGGTYSSMTLAGGAFVKRLLGNISVVATYTLTAPATVNLNGFALTNP